MSPADAYELQRAFQLDEKAAAGLRAGRPGPGGGAEATPFVVGSMLVGRTVSGLRSSANLTVWNYWNIPHEGTISSAWSGDRKLRFPDCPLTLRHLFGEALTFSWLTRRTRTAWIASFSAGTSKRRRSSTSMATR